MTIQAHVGKRVIGHAGLGDMKIKDIIVEDHVGKLSKRYKKAALGINKFRDSQHADRFYEINRIMMAAGMSDGVSPLPDHMDGESWAGRHDIAVPMTEIEQGKLKQAYKAIGSKWKDLNPGPFKSQELDIVNKKSPVAKRKKNKYGV